MYLIIHGFTSSSKSHIAQMFRRWLAEQNRESEWICPEKIFLMTERDDETLDWRKGAAYLSECHQLIFRGGNHSFRALKVSYF